MNTLNLIAILLYGNVLAKQSFPGSLVNSYNSYETSNASQEEAQDTGFLTDIYGYGKKVLLGLPFEYGLDLYNHYCEFI